MSATAKMSKATEAPSKKAKTSVKGRTPLGRRARPDEPVRVKLFPRPPHGAKAPDQGAMAPMIVAAVTMKFAVPWATMGAIKLPRRRYKKTRTMPMRKTGIK